MAGPAASSARQCRISRSACTDSRRGWCRGCRGDRRAPASRPLGSAARAGNRWLCSLRTRWPPPAGSVLPRSGRQADSATRTRIASAWAGTLDHASGPPVRAGSWSTTRLAGGPDAISRLEGVWLVQLARGRPVWEGPRIRGGRRGRGRAEPAVRDRVRPRRRAGSPGHGDLADDAVGADRYDRVEVRRRVGRLVVSHVAEWEDPDRLPSFEARFPGDQPGRDGATVGGGAVVEPARRQPAHAV